MKVDRNSREVTRIQAVLFSEKVCSDSNRGAACRALFDRLAESLSDNQRLRAACSMLAVLDLEETDALRRKAGCSPLIQR